MEKSVTGKDVLVYLAVLIMAGISMYNIFTAIM